MGRPAVLVDNLDQGNAGTLGDPAQRRDTGGASGSTRSSASSCTTRTTKVLQDHAVDFAARHFRPRGRSLDRRPGDPRRR